RIKNITVKINWLLVYWRDSGLTEARLFRMIVTLYDNANLTLFTQLTNGFIKRYSILPYLSVVMRCVDKGRKSIESFRISCDAHEGELSFAETQVLIQH